MQRRMADGHEQPVQRRESERSSVARVRWQLLPGPVLVVGRLCLARFGTQFSRRRRQQQVLLLLLLLQGCLPPSVHTSSTRAESSPLGLLDDGMHIGVVHVCLMPALAQQVPVSGVARP